MDTDPSIIWHGVTTGERNTAFNSILQMYNLISYQVMVQPSIVSTSYVDHNAAVMISTAKEEDTQIPG